MNILKQPLYEVMFALVGCLAVHGTWAAEPLAPIQQVEIGKHRELLVNGKPFFPIMSFAQEPRTFATLRSYGINTFCGNHGGKPVAKVFCDAAQAAGGYAMPHIDATGKGHPALLTYVQQDEPDMGIQKGKPALTAEEMVKRYQAAKAADNTRPVFQNLTSYFMVGPSWSTAKPEAQQAYYSVVVGAGDILAFDIYPIYGWNEDKQLTWVADGVTQLAKYAGPNKPIFAFIETAKGSQWISYEKQKDVKPEHIRAEVWMAIIRGATGIAYFTHAWRPTFKEFAPQGEALTEMTRVNGQIAKLSAAILDEPAKASVSIKLRGDAGDLAGEVLARASEGNLYLFTNNLDMDGRSGKATIMVPGLKKGAVIEVVDENRTLSADDGGFTDAFAALAVHIYRMKLP
ncbi:MAG: hypothetical protein AAB263_09170 [Planctomycetota bacterium]